MKPIKRNAAIVEFSKDHHFALLLVWKIREGLKKSIDPSRISRYTIHFYDTDLIYHFTDEETTLFNKLPSDNPLRVRAETEHKNIRQLINELRTNPGEMNLLEQFSDVLEKYVRFEERELFNHLQEIISDEGLAEIALLSKSRNHEPDEAWNDLFWKAD